MMGYLFDCIRKVTVGAVHNHITFSTTQTCNCKVEGEQSLSLEQFLLVVQV